MHGAGERGGAHQQTDLWQRRGAGELPFLNVIPICAKTGAGLDQLADAVDTMFENETPCDGSILTNARQFDAIRRAYEAMLPGSSGLQLGVTPDAVLTDVEQAMEAMGEITGATVREDITAPFSSGSAWENNRRKGIIT